jgi:hypothetical protein
MNRGPRALAIFSEGGRYSAVKLHIPSRQTQDERNMPRRGDVVGFSRKSRKRLFDLLAQIPDKAYSPGVLFVSLTYPNEFPSEPEIYKPHLEAFIKRFYRKIGKETPVLWRLEFQERGAPHFHLLIFGCRRLDIAWLSRTWYEVVDSGDEKHLAAGTNVMFVKDLRAILRYVSKYVAKESPGHNAKGGRVWGIRHKELLGIILRTVRISIPLALEIIEEMLAFLQGKGIQLDNVAHWGCRSMTCYSFPLQKILSEGV